MTLFWARSSTSFPHPFRRRIQKMHGPKRWQTKKMRRNSFGGKPVRRARCSRSGNCMKEIHFYCVQPLKRRMGTVCYSNSPNMTNILSLPLFWAKIPNLSTVVSCLSISLNSGRRVHPFLKALLTLKVDSTSSKKLEVQNVVLAGPYPHWKFEKDLIPILSAGFCWLTSRLLSC